jgi:hypothetical protein
MKKTINICAVCVLLLTLCSLAFADIAPIRTPKPTPTPKQVKSIDTNLTIRLVKDVKQARLVIPKSQIRELRAQLEQLDNDSSDETASVSNNFGHIQTIVSGLFLSFALVFGGVWLARSRKTEVKASKVLVIGSVMFLCGALATISFANMGPPLEARSITSKLFNPSVFTFKFATGKIKIETTDKTDGIELIVPDVPDNSKPKADE